VVILEFSSLRESLETTKNLFVRARARQFHRGLFKPEMNFMDNRPTHTPITRSRHARVSRPPRGHSVAAATGDFVDFSCGLSDTEQFTHSSAATLDGDDVSPQLAMNARSAVDPKCTNEGEMIMTNTTAVKDFVCGMDVDTTTAAGRSEYKGQAYYFCGSKCKEKFDLSPEQYLGKSAGTPKSGQSCCS
jgi:Cu+-exporting ATPase